ncbi:CTP:molybdopterin cytidylyltransferase [Escherichia coli]|nr:CTP:molybdopterin cytidylyltransferase [Escherichia coli]
MSAIDCIITAAGLSSRMGQWKMMLPWQQGTILDTSIKNALQFCSRIILVTGYRGNELHERYANQSNITIIHKPRLCPGFTNIRQGRSTRSANRTLFSHPR